jgi:hypothetical protein
MCIRNFHKYHISPLPKPFSSHFFGDVCYCNQIECVANDRRDDESPSDPSSRSQKKVTFFFELVRKRTTGGVMYGLDENLTVASWLSHPPWFPEASRNIQE